MKKRITCPHCKQHYEVDESEIAGFNEMTCNSCNKDFTLAGNITDIPEPKLEQSQVAPEENEDTLIMSWKTIAGVLSFVIVICVVLCVLPLALSANARDGGVVAACFGVSIAILITAFNFHILKVFARTATRTLERQNETKECQRQLLDAVKNLKNKH